MSFLKAVGGVLNFLTTPYNDYELAIVSRYGLMDWSTVGGFIHTI